MEDPIQSNHTHPKYYQTDIVLNYSFGHNDSALLLTPYGATVNYTNHSKERTNVRVQWTMEDLKAHKPDWYGKNHRLPIIAQQLHSCERELPHGMFDSGIARLRIRCRS